MKVSTGVLGNLAYQILSGAIDEGLSAVDTDIDEIEQAEVALYIKRSLAEGKKRIVIDVKTERPHDR